ncbi:MAG: SurA N-terminal domain-containing protein [Candidatus Saccharimonadaceae bacterium]
MKRPKLKVPSFKKDKNLTEPAGRITNETVAEHREKILAGGRKFKYPIQYARHKLVVNTIIISIGTILLASGFIWWQLYQAQNSSVVFYRITKVVPLPVAVVDDEQVKFSDYLRRYRSAEYYHIQYDKIKPETDDGRRQLNVARRRSMDSSIALAYAAKLARDYSITVSDQEVSDIIEQTKTTENGKVSQEAFDASAKQYYDWDPDEYRLDTKQRLLQQKVAYDMDKQAFDKQKQAAELVTQPNADFVAIAKQLGGEGKAMVEAGSPGLINISSSYRGLNSEAVRLEPGKISGAVKSSTGDGYYFIRLFSKSAEQVHYEYIHIPLTAFDEQLDKIKREGKVQEYIKITEDK